MSTSILCKSVCEIYGADCPNAANEITTVTDYATEGEGSNCSDLILKKKNGKECKYYKDGTKDNGSEWVLCKHESRKDNPFDGCIPCQYWEEEIYSPYFIGKKFIPKYLADEILKEQYILTYLDTRELLLYENGLFKKESGEDGVRLKALEKLDFEYNRKRINEVIEYVKLNTFVDRKQLDTEPFLINLRNGMYDVINDKLLPHDPIYKSTLQVNITYDPDAECPTILKFLNEIVDCENVLPLIQYAAYCFTTDIKMQKAGLLVGETENGKSTFLDMLSCAIGQENIAEQSIQSLNADKFSIAQLNGKLVNVFPDLPKTKLYDNSVFKMLTTDQYISGEEKYIAGYRFKNVTKQIYSANQVPALYDPDEAAFYRRWLIFEFPNSFKGDKADKNLNDKLTTETELSGFFNLAMVGLRALLKYKSFAYLKSDEDIKKLYLIKSNPISSFLDECVCYSESDYSKQALYEDYVDWCELNDITNVVKNNIFAKQLIKLGYEDYRESSGSRLTVWKNITPVKVGVKDKNTTLTTVKKPIDTYFDLIRQGSKVKSDIVEEYHKIYEYYYNNIISVKTLFAVTLTDGKTDKIVEPDNEKKPSWLKSNPDGTLTDCQSCNIEYPADQLQSLPGIDRICPVCIKAKNKKEDNKFKTPTNNFEYVTVTANRDIPLFLGIDEKSYILKNQDMAVIPSINAKALIKRNAVKLVNVGGMLS